MKTFYDFRVGNIFKTRHNFKNEEIIDNLDNVKIKNFYVSKDIIKRLKRQAIE